MLCSGSAKSSLGKRLTRSWAQNKISNFSSVPYYWWRALLIARERLQPSLDRTKCRVTVTHLLLQQILILFYLFLLLSYLTIVRRGKEFILMHLPEKWWISILGFNLRVFWNGKWTMWILKFDVQISINWICNFWWWF